MAKRNKAVGRYGEKVTANYLTQNGFKILDKNWRIREGEIDIVAMSPQGKIHFVEVKTRSSESFGHPLEAIDRHKAFRLQRLALAWLATHQRFGSDYQIDVSAITLNSSQSPFLDYRSGVV